jgi:hypothetical protein
MVFTTFYSLTWPAIEPNSDLIDWWSDTRLIDEEHSSRVIRHVERNHPRVHFRHKAAGDLGQSINVVF